VPLAVVGEPEVPDPKAVFAECHPSALDRALDQRLDELALEDQKTLAR